MLPVALLVLYLKYYSMANELYRREKVQEKFPGFGNDYIFMGEEPNGTYTVGFLSQSGSRGLMSPEPSEVVTFTLYTRELPGGQLVDIHEKPEIFDPSKPTKFVTHGFMSSGTSDSCELLKDGFLKKYDCNVIVMDWSGISGIVFYPIPMKATTSVGDYYAAFINKLVKYGANPKDMHLVGHSLGAHVSGFAARKVIGRVARVTGLDPALPGFSVDSPNCLNKADAEFVDVIHTCAGFLGLPDPIGHVDFYPNGGSVPQPGCDSVLPLMEACSHGKSWKYFSSSLHGTKLYKALKCNSFNWYKDGNCDVREIVEMGDATPPTARGYFYLKTKS